MAKKIFLDQEFLEGFRTPLFGRARHFIDLISIGLIDEDGREYYAVCKEFDIKAAYYRGDEQEDGSTVYWLRDNVLKAVWKELEYTDYRASENCIKIGFFNILDSLPDEDAKVKFYTEDMQISNSPKIHFSFARLKQLIYRYGKSRKQIREEIYDFVNPHYQGHTTTEPTSADADVDGLMFPHWVKVVSPDYKPNEVEFWGYFADYDWVLFCSIFGKMIDLPKGFPKYCKDLKQAFDYVAIRFSKLNSGNFHLAAKELKAHPHYPPQANEHHALSDARWNRALHKFLHQT